MRCRDVFIEGRCNSSLIVVCIKQDLAVFDEVYAQQHRVPWRELGAKVAQQLQRRRRIEVANARTDVEHQAAFAPGVDLPQSLGVVGDASVYRDVWQVRLRSCAGLVEGRCGEVDRVVVQRLLPGGRGASSSPVFVAVPAPSSIMVTGPVPAALDDVSRMFGEYLALGTGDVVLRQGSDLFEEPRAFRVVEKPWAEGLRARAVSP